MIYRAGTGIWRIGLPGIATARPAVAAGSWWLAGGIDAADVVAAYQFVGAESQAASYVNLANPGTHDLTVPVAAPTWSAETGLSFNGTSQYLNSGIVPGNNYSVIARFSGAALAGIPLGCRIAIANQEFLLMADAGSNLRAYRYSANNPQAPSVTSGVMGMAGTTCWLNGTLSAGTVTGTISATLPIWVGAAKSTGSRTGGAITLQGLAIYSANIADAMPDLSDAILTFEYVAPTALSGVWTFYTKPRAVHYNNKTYIGVVDTRGDIEVAAVNHAAGDVVSKTRLHAALEVNDHSGPALLIRDSDKRIMAFYSRHNGATHRLRISTNAQDISAFDAVVSLDAQLGGTSYTYANPIQLTGEANDPIYLFYRDFSVGVMMSKSVDDGATWAAQTTLFANGTERPYFQMRPNGTDRIDFAVNDGHPAEVATNSLYHFYYTGGNYYKSDGTLIGDGTALPLAPADVTEVYDGTTTESWVWDIAVDGSGNPVIVYATFPNPDSDHRYRYARWNGTSWDDYEIVAHGGGSIGGVVLPDQSAYYSGGICLDQANPNICYLSRWVSSQLEVYKYVTADGGATWTPTALTTGSSEKNIRPEVPTNAHANLQVLWLAGTYISYTNYSMRVRGYPAGILD